MTHKESLKVFLSHRGADKLLVRDFADTLRLLGFEPWLDEAQMAAGATLHRALLQGFKESCAAVFFVTPAFEDERYLAKEVDYAVHEALERPDRFKIITLVFQVNGQKGTVPELLRSYVWKEPASQLEALREIIRALPASVGKVDWRDRSIATSTQQQVLWRYLDESREPAYTDAKEHIAKWAEAHHGAFAPDQIVGSSEFGVRLRNAWEDYDDAKNKILQDARKVFNKFWDRLVSDFDVTGLGYHHVFELLGDNLRLMAITHPIEILLAKKLGTSGMPNLSRLLDIFQSWLSEDPVRAAAFRAKGFEVKRDAVVWTQVWPWRV